MSRHLTGLALLALLLPRTLCAAIESTTAPDAAVPAVEAAPVAAPLAATPETYALKTCPISGDELGGMGDPIVLDVKGLTVQVCCAHCEGPVKEQIGAIRKSITKALVTRDGPSYPLTTCVACGKPLPKKPINLVHGSTLIRVDQEICAAELAGQGAAWSLQVRQARAANLKD